MTFVPSFLFVFLGAPYMERLRGNRSLSAALTGITAAVVGVIANLGVYFAMHTLFAETRTVDRRALPLELPDLAHAATGRAGHRRRRRRADLPAALVGAAHPRRVRRARARRRAGRACPSPDASGSARLSRGRGRALCEGGAPCRAAGRPPSR